MDSYFILARQFSRFSLVLLSIIMAAGIPVAAEAQTQRSTTPITVEPPTRGGTASSPAQAATPSASAPTPGQPTAGSTTSIARIDTTYVLPDATAVIMLRPAQIMTSANTANLPIEVASAAGIKYLGLDPANVEEFVACVHYTPDMPLQVYAVSLKFIQPFRGQDISPSIRAHTQRGELAGRPYLQSPVPLMPSYYAPDNRTLVVAPDETLRKLVATKTPVTPGAATARARLVRGHHDFYVSIDVASLLHPQAESDQDGEGPMGDRGSADRRGAAESDRGRGGQSQDRMAAGPSPTAEPNPAVLQMMAGGQLPTELTSALEGLNLIRSVELTVNLSNAGPILLVVHANDSQSATKLETMITESLKNSQEEMTAKVRDQSANSDDPIQKAIAAYVQRMSSKWTSFFRPQRSGASLTLYRSEGDSPERRLVTNAVGWIVTAAYTQDLPAMFASASGGGPNQGMMDTMTPMMRGEQQPVDPSQLFGPGGRGEMPMDMGRGDGRGDGRDGGRGDGRGESMDEFPGGRGAPVDDGSRGRGDGGERGNPVDENVGRGRDGGPVR
jgi:hypothetical protein